jgi:hypothetical protein
VNVPLALPEPSTTGTETAEGELMRGTRSTSVVEETVVAAVGTMSTSGAVNVTKPVAEIDPPVLIVIRFPLSSAVNAIELPEMGSFTLISTAEDVRAPLAVDDEPSVTAPLVPGPKVSMPVAEIAAAAFDSNETVGFPVSLSETAPEVDVSCRSDEFDGPGSVFLTLTPPGPDAVIARTLVINGKDDGENAPMVPPALSDAEPLTAAMSVADWFVPSRIFPPL